MLPSEVWGGQPAWVSPGRGSETLCEEKRRKRGRVPRRVEPRLTLRSRPLEWRSGTTYGGGGVPQGPVLPVSWVNPLSTGIREGSAWLCWQIKSDGVVGVESEVEWGCGASGIIRGGLTRSLLEWGVLGGPHVGL